MIIKPVVLFLMNGHGKTNEDLLFINYIGLFGNSKFFNRKIGMSSGWVNSQHPLFLIS